jgi:DNA-binding transcriptional MerR regulator
MQEADNLRLYRAGAVCAATGVKPITLRQWHLRGIIQPEIEVLADVAEIHRSLGAEALPRKLRDAEQAAKVQRWRQYTFNDIVRVAIVRRLVLLGLSPERAAKIARGADGEKSLVWPVPKKTVKGVVVQQAGEEKRVEKYDSLLVSIVPREDLEESASGLSDAEFEDAEDRMISMATNSYIGRERLEFAFRKREDNEKLAFGDPSCGVVVNVSEIAREVERRLEGYKSAGGD